MRSVLNRTLCKASSLLRTPLSCLNHTMTSRTRTSKRRLATTPTAATTKAAKTKKVKPITTGEDDDGYWLIKSEPSEFSIDDLLNSDTQTEHWDGVRNYQARNFMRDRMKIGHQCFFYHSNTKVPGIAGIVQVCKESYPDFTSWNPKDKHYDPKSSEDNPRWFMVDVKFVRKFSSVVSLQSLKDTPALSSMKVVQRGNRLSISPVSKHEWDTIIELEKEQNK